MTPTPDKKALRAHYAALRDGLTEGERAAAEEVICRRLFSLAAWQRAPLVCSYVSMRGELRTAPIHDRAAAEGKGIALPVTVTGAREGRMIFRRLPHPVTNHLVTARFGIPEPDDACPTLSPRDLAEALILVPGLVFDREGYRLGYGGGYYDRFLSSLREADIPFTTVGLVFARCRAATLPRETFDLPVNLVIDES